MIRKKMTPVFRKDHAQTKSWSVMMTQPELIARQADYMERANWRPPSQLSRIE
jgi:hypothetical protein